MALDPLSFSALCCGLLPCLPVSDDQCRDLAGVSLRFWARRRRDRAARVNLFPRLWVAPNSYRGPSGSLWAASSPRRAARHRGWRRHAFRHRVELPRASCCARHDWAWRCGRVDGRTQGHRHLVSWRARRARQRLDDHVGIVRRGHGDGANRLVAELFWLAEPVRSPDDRDVRGKWTHLYGRSGARS